MAPDARCGSGNGTLERPWCIHDALDSKRIKPGDTLLARLGGRYGLIQKGGRFVSIVSTLRGEPDKRITVRPYPPDQTSPTTLIRVACDQGEQSKPDACMSIESNWVDYYDFEVAYFGDPMREAGGKERDPKGFGAGVRAIADRDKTSGIGNRIINWVVHDTSNNVFKADRANPIDFYGTIQYNFGFLYNQSKVQRVGGHAFYLRNGIDAKGRVEGCTGSGVDDSEPARSALIDNIVSGAILVEGFSASSAAYQDYGTCACVMHRNELFDGNFFMGGTLSGGCPARDSTLGTRDQTLTNNWWSGYHLGYMCAGCDNVTIDGNFMFRPMYSTNDKYYANRSPMYITQQRNKKFNPCKSRVKFTNNVYWGKTDNKNKESDDDKINGFIGDWFPGQGNVYHPNEQPPDRNYTAVRPNAFRPGSCNVYVANFRDAASVAIDLSRCGLADGATFEVRSIYDYMGAPVRTGTFSAGSPTVEFPMTPAANPISNSVGHREGGAPGSYPDIRHSLTKPGGNIFRNAFVVLTTKAPG
jgi:hypothetical protein